MRGVSPLDPSSLRLDQWLWYARFAKSRSRAARLCAAGAVTVNGVAVKKAHYAIRVGDVVVVPHGVLARTVLVKALGERRGPSPEARSLYVDAPAPVRVPELSPAWTPLLADYPAKEPTTRNNS
jgi:ribosome-associated heat shock protein Hsp15